jgi:hypothetical protein
VDRELDNKEAVAGDYYNLGNLYEERLDYEQAKAFYTRAYGLYEEIQSKPQMELMQNLIKGLKQASRQIS